MLTMIVPTYNEKENITRLIGELEKVRNIKILVVDDNSPDGTGIIAEKLRKRYKNLDVLHRKVKNGLGPAILDGFRHANTDEIGVMDADFSHPPELLPKMILELKKADIVIASRYVKGGGTDEDWSFFRRLVSKCAIAIARPITGVHDTMSGFFVLKKKIIKNAMLAPSSCKICLEILAKGSYSAAIEVPYVFCNRKMGKSKIMNGTEILRYISHVAALYVYKITVFCTPRRNG
jgi:dolichol-phosphate mannosyltransferase